MTDTPHAHINNQLNQNYGGPISTATLPSLNKRVEALERRLRIAGGQ
ncbi:hypothetical protein [Streptomyces sp. NPDC054901]